MEYDYLLEDSVFLRKFRQALAGQICIWGDSSRLHIDQSARMVNTLFNTSSGSIQIGANTFTGHNVCILAGTHEIFHEGLERMDFPKNGYDIEIGAGVWIASNVTILGPCSIEDNAVIAAGAVVVPGTHIRKGELWAGVPAKKKKLINISDVEKNQERAYSMQHKLADSVLREVEQYYMGDFLLNGDVTLSRQINRSFQKKEQNRFYGNNGLFTPLKMYGTDGCEKTTDYIRVPQGGTVYGPYFTFPAGAYCAKFHIDQVEKAVISVSCQENGVIASQCVESSIDSFFSLDFSLEKTTAQLEFKVENNAIGAVIFRSVEIVPDGLPIQIPNISISGEKKETAEEIQSIASIISDDLNGLAVLKRQLRQRQKSLENKANCNLPEGTRLHRIKKFIRRMIRPYTLMQKDYNHAVNASIANIYAQIDLIADALARVDQQTKDLVSSQQKNSELADILPRIDKQAKEIVCLQQRNSELADSLAKVDQHAKEIISLQQKNSEIIDTLTRFEAQNLVVVELQQQCSKLIEQIDFLRDKTSQISEFSNADIRAQQEISNLWRKIESYDSEFRNIWKLQSEVNTNLSSIWNTYSTFRQEFFYELEARTRYASVSQPECIKTKIKESGKEKIQLANGNIRLNLGSGNLVVEGYINIDARDMSNVDIVADVAELPFEVGTVEEIFSSHLIEHFTRNRMENELLPYWYSLLKNGGLFRVIFPDLEAMIHAYNASQMSFEQMSNIIMGGQDYQLDYHFSTYAPDTVISVLEKTGFHNIRIIARGRENGGCKETEIIAEK